MTKAVMIRTFKSTCSRYLRWGLCVILVFSSSVLLAGCSESPSSGYHDPTRNVESVPFNSTTQNSLPQDNGYLESLEDPDRELFLYNKLVYEIPVEASLAVPCLLQNPELPTGCESVALTNTLLYHGFSLEKTTIADSWLPLSDTDFVKSFLGSPYDPYSYACMAPCIESTANAYLRAQGSSLRAQDISGTPFEELFRLVSEGNPVIVWNTINLEKPGEPYEVKTVNGKKYYLFGNSHCVVLSGYDLAEGVVLVSDSLKGRTTYNLAQFENRYNRLGMQAIIIV